MKILLVTTRYPWPPRRGLELRSLQFADWLSREHDVTLLAPRPPGAAPASPTGTYRCELYPTHRIYAAFGVVRALAAGRPLQAGFYEQPGLSAALGRLVPETDFVLAQLARLASHLGALKRKPLLVDFVDALGMSFARRALVDQPSRRWLWRLEARWLDHHERLLAESAAASWIVSERDRAHLVSGLSPAAASRLRVLPPAVALPPPGPRLEEPSLLVVTGNLGYHPTVEGLVWWLREVWPILSARRPELKLLLAGSRPATAVQGAARQAGVELRVDPPDLADVLARATVALAPARSGAGVPMKVLEAWAAGVPVVAHPWSAFGAGGVENAHLLVAETREQWVEACSRLLDSPAERERLRQAAWARVRQAFAPDVLAGQLLEQVREVAANR